MKNRPILPEDLVNWNVIINDVSVMKYGRVLDGGTSQMINVQCLHDGSNKIDQVYVVQLSMIVVCE